MCFFQVVCPVGRKASCRIRSLQTQTVVPDRVDDAVAICLQTSADSTALTRSVDCIPGTVPPQLGTWKRAKLGSWMLNVWRRELDVETCMIKVLSAGYRSRHTTGTRLWEQADGCADSATGEIQGRE